MTRIPTSKRLTPTKVRARRDNFCIDEIPTKDVSGGKSWTDNERRSCSHHKRRSTSLGSPVRRYRRSFPEFICTSPRRRRVHKRSYSEENKQWRSVRKNQVIPVYKHLSSAARHVPCSKSRNNSANFSDTSEETGDVQNTALSRNIYKLWKNGRLCDVVIHADGKRFYAHKLVMAAACDHFAKQHTSDRPIIEFNIPNIRQSVMSDVVEYFYTSKLEVTEENVQELVDLSQHLGIRKIMKMCIAFLNEVTLTNAVSNMSIAREYHLNDVAEKINKYVHEHFETLVSSESFLRTDFKMVHEIVSSELLTTPDDLMIFHACAAWVNFDRAQRIKYAESLMGIVNFQAIPAQDLVSQVENVGFVTDIPACREMLYSAYKYHALNKNGTEPRRGDGPRRKSLQIQPSAKRLSTHSLTRETRSTPSLHRKQESTTSTEAKLAGDSHTARNIDNDDEGGSDTSEEESKDQVPLQPMQSRISGRGSMRKVSASIRNFAGSILNIPLKARSSKSKPSAMSVKRVKASRDDLVKDTEFTDTENLQSNVNLNTAVSAVSHRGEKDRKPSGNSVHIDETAAAKFSDLSVVDTYPQGKESQLSAARSAPGMRTQCCRKGSRHPSMLNQKSDHHLRDTTSVSRQASGMKSKLQVHGGSSRCSDMAISGRLSSNPVTAFPGAAVCDEESSEDPTKLRPSFSKRHSHMSQHKSDTVFPSHLRPEDSKKALSSSVTLKRGTSSKRLSPTLGHGATGSSQTSSSENELKDVTRRISKSIDMTGNSCYNVKKSCNPVNLENHKPECFVHQYFRSKPHQMSLSPITSEDSRDVANLPLPPTPTVILIMGGVNPYQDCFTTSHESNSVQQFYPDQNSWSIRSHLPMAVHHFAVAEISGKIIVTGGLLSHSEDVSPLKECHCYDVSKNKWKTISALKTARSHHAAVHLNGLVYVLGGEDCVQMSLKTAEVYNPNENTWEFTSPMKDARSGLAAIPHRDRILVVGGMLDIDEKFLLDSVEVYDPKTAKWTFRFPLPVSICDTSLAEVNAVVYMVGGYVMKDKEPLSMDSVFRYCDETDSWDGFHTLHVPRHSAVVAALGNRIYVIGGESTAAMGHALSNVECIDADKKKHVSEIAPLLAPAYGIAGCVLNSDIR